MPKKIIKKPAEPKENGRPRNLDLDKIQFASMEHCEGATGIPKTIQQAAKSAGCIAFDAHNRIRLGDLIRWIFKEGIKSDMTDWGELNTELDAKLKQVKLDSQLRELIAKDEVQTVVQQIIGTCTTIVKRATIEFPKSLEMRSATDIKGLCDPMYKEAIRRMESEFEKLNIKPKEQK